MDELCLSVKALGFSERIDTVLSSAIEPPDSESVATTVNGLKGLGAFNEDESMTALGHTLAKLPLEPRIGKMLVLGAVFGVLGPCLTIAATISTRDPFLRPLHRRDEADAARRFFAEESQSDHLMYVRAYRAWDSASMDGRDREMDFCDRHFISRNAMMNVRRTRDQLRGESGLDK